jgi:BirA family biotin operon repressor/biotin-[acetyl-CoA-carboxylase] ligase
MSTDARILAALRRVVEEGVSAADLARAAGITEQQLHARITELRALGYDIALTPHIGYHLLDSPDALHADDLLARIGEAHVVGRDIRVFHETTSTNDVVEKLARDGVREGAVVFAESQTRGRGRLGRRWMSPPGQGLWFSVLLRPALPPQAATQLTIIGATAVARAIREQTGLTPQIKWPNDILLGGRKAVGILTELSAELDQVRHLVLGIGVDVNVTEFPGDLSAIATSLAIAAGRPVSRPALAAAILRELDADYRRVCDGGFAGLAEEWEQQCITLGRRVRIHIGDRAISGLAESLDTDGALLVRGEHGRLERIIGGDVLIERE